MFLSGEREKNIYIANENPFDLILNIFYTAKFYSRDHVADWWNYGHEQKKSYSKCFFSKSLRWRQLSLWNLDAPAAKLSSAVKSGIFSQNLKRLERLSNRMLQLTLAPCENGPKNIVFMAVCIGTRQKEKKKHTHYREMWGENNRVSFKWVYL